MRDQGILSGLFSWFNPWVVLGSAVVALVLTIACLASLWLLRPTGQQSAPATAALFIIPAPSLTPVITPQPTLTPTPAGVLPPIPDIAIGNYVQISGTGVDGLRLRSDPGLQGQIRLVAIEAEVFQVIDGPRSGDGYTWWLLRAPYDETRLGWAVANYLAPVQNP